MLPYRLSRISVAILMIGTLLLMATVEARAVRSGSKRSHSTSAPGVSSVERISEQWAKEWSAGNPDALMALYAEDAVFLTATGSRSTGRAAIRELFQRLLPRTARTFTCRAR
jgi:hypothetical protein